MTKAVFVRYIILSKPLSTPLTTLLIAVFFDLGEGKPKGKAKKHDMEKTARQSRKRVL